MVAFSPMRNCEFGYASALAMIMFVIVMVLTLVQHLPRTRQRESLQLVTVTQV